MFFVCRSRLNPRIWPRRPQSFEGHEINDSDREFNREVESRLNPKICPRIPQSFEGLEINDSDRDFSREVESHLNQFVLSAGCPKIVELVF